MVTVRTMDFIRIEYTGYDEKGVVFDSTAGEVAKTLHKKEGPLLLIFGKDRLIPALEEAISKMNVGEEIEVEAPPEKAFGIPKKSLVKVMRPSYFAAQKIKPTAGMAIHLDTDYGRLFGVIKSVSSGRVVVDFNHPLAGKKVRYKIKLNAVITKTEDKIDALLLESGLKGNATLKDRSLDLELIKKGGDYEQKKAQLLVLLKGLFHNEIKSINVNEVEEKKSKE